ncbi:MAG: hypothetical protein ACEY3F_06545 [Wolbachia sp.]
MPRHWDPEDLILTKWLHNKDWMPDWHDTIHGLLNYFSHKY